MMPFDCPDESHTEIGLCVAALADDARPSEASPAELAAVVPCLIARVQQRIVRLVERKHDDWPWLEREVLDDLDLLLDNLDTRWLVAICNAYADHGTDVERRNAMCVSLLVHWERLALSCRLDGAFPKVASGTEPLWDGITAAPDPKSPEGLPATFRRLNGLLAETPAIHRIFLRIVERMLQNDGSTIRSLDAPTGGQLLSDLVEALGSPRSMPSRAQVAPEPVPSVKDVPNEAAASSPGALDPADFQGLVLQALQGATGGLSALFRKQEEDRAQVDLSFGMLNAAFAKLASGLEQFISTRFAQHCWIDEVRHRDVLELLDRIRPIAGSADVELRTEYPVAEDTIDHRHPHGTARDNTRAPWFVAKCEEVWGRELSALDLGCAGGGLVFDFTLRGHRAVGLEGSDYSSRRMRAEWRTLQDRLFTCDVTHPFELVDTRTGSAAAFDVVTAWDVMEHFPESALRQVFDNVRAHLRPGGMFVGSLSTVPSINAPDGTSYHATVQPRHWWADKFREHGFELVRDSPFEATDFARGNNSSPAYATDFHARPDLGFHFVARPIARD